MAARRERQAQVLPHECRPGVCQLSSASSDGFGHQLDAKLSCIAVAHRIGMRYVHVPFRGSAHGENLAPLEVHVGLNRSFQLNSIGDHPRWNSRQRAAPSWWPAPYGRHGACSGKPYLYSWLLQMDLVRHNASAYRPALCCTNVVYINDNCWDYFICHPHWPGLWNDVKPRVQQAYFSTPKPDPEWLHGFELQQPNARQRVQALRSAVKVVVHARFDDVAHNRLPPNWYANTIKQALQSVAAGRRQHAVVRIQTNGKPRDIEPILSLLDGPTLARVVIDWAANTSLSLAFHRMVISDVLVMSRSSLSNAAALLSDGIVYFPLCWASDRRPMPHWRQLPCNVPVVRDLFVNPNAAPENKVHILS